MLKFLDVAPHLENLPPATTGIEGGRERWLFTPPRQFVPDQRLEPTTFGLQVRLSIH